MEREWTRGRKERKDGPMEGRKAKAGKGRWRGSPTQHQLTSALEKCRAPGLLAAQSNCLMESYHLQGACRPVTSPSAVALVTRDWCGPALLVYPTVAVPVVSTKH